MPDRSRVRRLSRGQRIAVGISVTLGLALAGYGVAGSYETVSDLARREWVPLPHLVPVGIDGGIVGVVALDLVFTWTGQPLGWLRQLVRLLTIGTVAANAAAGWPDPIAVGLHDAAPLMLLSMVEAGRAVLLRLLGERNGTRRDRIPLARWVLAPWRTWLLWRRMVLWSISDYHHAVEIELSLGRAITLLRATYGSRWMRDAPAELVWMLRTGVSAAEACARVRVLAQADGANSGMGDDAGAEHTRAGNVHGPAIDQERLREALQLNKRHWATTGRPASAETVRKHLRIGAAGARALTRAVREVDRAAVVTGGIQGSSNFPWQRDRR